MCWVHVVPHLGYVEMIMSSGRGRYGIQRRLSQLHVRYSRSGGLIILGTILSFTKNFPEGCLDRVAAKVKRSASARKRAEMAGRGSRNAILSFAPRFDPRKNRV